jgi:tRNA-specific 2-thiouridylase
MGLSHITLDLEGRFREAVVRDYVVEHDRGRTPNPCVRCNGLVRFDAMLELADRVGAATLSTGHYARIVATSEGPLLARAADGEKDQSYMLAALAPELLARVRFPLGALTKPRVRDIAREAGLAVADKVESQDLCFLAGSGRDAFLARRGARETPGDVVDEAGRKLGRHPGQRRFTVGQRRGLGVSSPEPLFVLSKDARANRLVVGPHASLATRRVRISPAVLHRDGAQVDRVKLRYRSPAVACAVEDAPPVGRHPSLTLALEQDTFGVAPGQTACLMRGDVVVGYGTIAARLHPEPAAAPGSAGVIDVALTGAS